MRVGVCLPAGDGPDPVASYAAIRALGIRAEELGLDSIWVSDHLLFRSPDEPEEGLLEGWTVLTALAEATSTVLLGDLVVCTGFRNPGLMAKMAQTLDAISGGRLILGLGAGWHDPEYEAFDYPTDHKVGRFEEALAIISSLIRTGRSTYEGRWTSTRDAALIPPARPDLEIMVAGMRPRMLGLTARFADSWNGAWAGRPSAPRIAEARGILETAMAEAGRDAGSLRLTVGVRVAFSGLLEVLPDPSDPDRLLSGTVEEVAAGLAAFRDAGWDEAIVWLYPETPEGLEALGEAVARFRSA